MSWSLLYRPKAGIITAQSRHHHSHLLLFSEDSWALFFLPTLSGLPPPVFHSPHTHWQPIPHTATLTPNTRMGFWKDPLSSDRENHLIRTLKSRKLCLFWFWLSPPLCAVWFDNSMTGSLPTIDLLEQRDAGKEVWRCTVTVTEESSLWNAAYTCMRAVHPWFSTMTSVQMPEWLLFKRISLLKCILVSGFEEEFMAIFYPQWSVAWETNYGGENLLAIPSWVRMPEKKGGRNKTNADIHFWSWQRFAESLISWWGTNNVAVKYSTCPAETRSNSDCTVDLSITKVFPRMLPASRVI